ncbi:ABC transporter ATP-binding protein [Anaerobacillus isosaccharinicus]|uniref:ABC transporter ATP-binding protein n=1 Tax=Anaerobacillus isosaccharinicus TaxID=1532552 RepID=A0A1S2M8X3_9BACI|nr:ABC transporter ATP-binding protein [Anaerobacillus isosaccharinicus]MBA5587232.1 ABC transporter ATP-binding protein [Anaerobacillus isosaccharinicus]QOY34574.1 ABC transporter ATP-binding protein [Anaerobacillus isosaccharinicus]
MSDKNKESLLFEPMNQKLVFKRLITYTKPHIRWLTIAFVLLLLGTGAQILGPILVKIFIDDYLTPRIFDFQPLLWLGAGYLGLHFASVAITYVQLFLFQKIALQIIQQLRIDVFEKVQNLGLAFFDKFPTGGLVSRITNDTETIKDLYVSVLSNYVQNGMFLIGVFVAMFYLNVQLALFCLFILPILLILMQAYRRFSSKFYAEMSEKLSQLNAKISESIQGMTVIQIFRQEKRLRKEFEKINDEHQKAWLKSIKLDGLLLRPAVDFVSIMALVLVLSFFGITSFNSPVEIGVLYAFINYLDRFFEPVNQMMMRLSIFQQAIVSASRVFRLLDHDEIAPGQKGEGYPLIEKGEVEFRNVSFSYDGKHEVLKNISFTAKKGETIALVGHTGSGKSSIINLLMRFYPGVKGDILLDGVPIEKFTNEELRKKMGLVLQDPFLFVGTVEDNIRFYSHELTKEEIIHAAKFVHAESFIKNLPEGYDAKIGERGSTLSSGQRQLLSFARTIALNPSILVLDEATANVDTETEGEIQKALEKMRLGRTTIAIAHRLSTIQDADQILVLHQGEIVERGNHQELIKQGGLYHKMYLLQQGDPEEIEQVTTSEFA